MIAYLWIFFPIAYGLYAITVLAVNTSGLLMMILSPWYWFISAVAIFSGTGILKIQWYAWYVFLFSNFTIVYQTVVVLIQYSVGDLRVVSFIATIALQILAVFLVTREIRVPYFFPRIRWWESDPRYQLSIPVKVERVGQAIIDAEIVDISVAGCFIKTPVTCQFEEEVTLDFSLFERSVKCAGKILWQAESTVTHPKGIGVKFTEIDRKALKIIKRSTKRIRNLVKLYNLLNRERNWREYLEREKTYQEKAKYRK